MVAKRQVTLSEQCEMLFANDQKYDDDRKSTLREIHSWIYWMKGQLATAHWENRVVEITLSFCSRHWFDQRPPRKKSKFHKARGDSPISPTRLCPEADAVPSHLSLELQKNFEGIQVRFCSIDFTLLF